MKILYVTTIGITMKFFDRFIKELIDEGHVVDIICNEADIKVPDCYREWKCNVFHHSCSRSPFSLGNVKAIKEIRDLVEQNNYDIVHCHTPIAALCTRLACRKERKKGLKVIYTAHGFHFYKGAPLLNWLIYYPIEKLGSYFTDVLITINKEDYELAKNKMKAKQVEYVPGVGIDVDKFKNTVVDKKEKRKELGIPEDAFLLVSVGELNKNKNHEVIIKAMSQINNENIHYAIAGVGPLHDYLLDLAKSLNLENRVHLLGYRTDVAEIYKSGDVCCFPSIREGLGLAAIEAMACGLPVVAAKNRGTFEFVEHNKNGFLVDYQDVNMYATLISRLFNDVTLLKCISQNTKNTILTFNISNVMNIMKRIYGVYYE